MRDMLGREDAISVDEALKRILGHLSVKGPSVARLQIEDCYRRVLAEDICSPEDLPAFSRSTVDGFAVKSSDTFGSSETIPSYLNVSHEVLMGLEPHFELKKGIAAKIPTGGMLPSGADAVVMLEHVQTSEEGLIEVLKPVAPGENVIFAGEDVEKGEVILRKGALLRPQDIAAVAGIGIKELAIYERPRVSIISTGDEIVPAGKPLGPGQVRDINSYNLAGLIRENGGEAVRKGIFRDAYEDIRNVAAESLRESEMVLISGGSSVGVMDLTAGIIDSLGRPGVVFHGVALKPGKPTIGGVVTGIPVFGLPGHPAAVTICFDLLIKPVLRVLKGVRGKEFLEGRAVKARLARNVSSTHGREEHIRVYLEQRNSELWAVPVLGKSGLIRTLVMADGTVAIPRQVRGIQEGEVVEVSLF
ncbi:MAG TPA: gephyrin-like molybdotransferase Glp [Thermodesulfovibrionales bacterium]|nr:gephyrin-like molybdotransferase Glp [Thermodesulfovibrionales bacterium]